MRFECNLYGNFVGCSVKKRKIQNDPSLDLQNRVPVQLCPSGYAVQDGFLVVWECKSIKSIFGLLTRIIK